MKKQLVNTSTRIGLLTAIAMVTSFGSAQGQSLSSKLRAKVPFDFIVAGKTLPAGEYFVGRLRQDSDDGVLWISSADGLSRAMRLTSPVDASVAKDEAMLVFHRYGDQYFLFQVWPAGATTGRQLLKSRSERDIERRTALAKAEPVETVTVVAALK